jgi:hypothetical protein
MHVTGTERRAQAKPKLGFHIQSISVLDAEQFIQLLTYCT